MLSEKIRNNVKGKNVKIGFCEIDDKRIIESARFLKDNNLLEPVLIGKDIEKKAKLFDISISDIKKINTKKDTKHAVEFSMNLLDQSKIDGFVNGAIHPTSETLRPALKIIGGKNDFDGFVSSFFIMEKKDSLYFFSDCAMNPSPNIKQLSSIALQTAISAKKFIENPKIAMLSFSTNSSSNHKLAKKVKKALELTKKRKKEHKLDCEFDGEMQLDCAIDKVVANKKYPKSSVAGFANVLIFPNLDSGNIGYKLVERFANYKAIGPILQGLKKPVNDLSRGASIDDIIDVACITAYQFLEEN
ncbi:MAG: phosphate acyltransferase [Candidatus Woesearchaeota archaeon]